MYNYINISNNKYKLQVKFYCNTFLKKKKKCQVTQLITHDILKDTD